MLVKMTGLRKGGYRARSKQMICTAHYSSFLASNFRHAQMVVDDVKKQGIFALVGLTFTSPARLGRLRVKPNLSGPPTPRFLHVTFYTTLPTPRSMARTTRSSGAANTGKASPPLADISTSSHAHRRTPISSSTRDNC